MLIPLTLTRDQPLQQQIYEQLRDLVRTGRLAAGMRMTSTRMVADQFGVSRITVLLTYERLIAEGYLETIPAVGTFVSRTLPGATPPAVAAVPGLAERAPPPPWEKEVGSPDPRLFPAGRWRALVRSALDRLGMHLRSWDPSGSPELRRAVAGWLSASRGLTVDAEQVLILGSRQQALHLATHLLLTPGAQVALEDPCDRHSLRLYAESGAEIVPIPVDDAGLRTALLPEAQVALVHVTPERQRPLGGVLSAGRRRSLLDWAGRVGATVLEEDCDGDLRYEAMTAPSLMSLDRNQRVIHIGCFGATLGPGSSLGYIVLPDRLLGAAHAAIHLVDHQTRWMEEAALTSFLDSGDYARHVHRVRKTYRHRRDTLVPALRDCIDASAQIAGTSAGLLLSWSVPRRFGPAQDFAALARRCGLDAAAVTGLPVVLFGYGAPDEQQIETGIRRLAEGLEVIAAVSQAWC